MSIDDYGNEFVGVADDELTDLAASKRREYACQWAYVEALPIIEEMGLLYFINMIMERYKNEQRI